MVDFEIIDGWLMQFRAPNSLSLQPWPGPEPLDRLASEPARNCWLCIKIHQATCVRFSCSSVLRIDVPCAHVVIVPVLVQLDIKRLMLRACLAGRWLVCYSESNSWDSYATAFFCTPCCTYSWLCACVWGSLFDQCFLSAGLWQPHHADVPRSKLASSRCQRGTNAHVAKCNAVVALDVPLPQRRVV